MTTRLSIRDAREISEKLKAHLQAQSITHNRVHLRLSDDGLGLVVVAPTESHNQIPTEFQGLSVLVREPLEMTGW
jgi:hypothetical protein